MKRDEDSRVDNGVVWGSTGFMFLVIGVPIISVFFFCGYAFGAAVDAIGKTRESEKLDLLI